MLSPLRHCFVNTINVYDDGSIWQHLLVERAASGVDDQTWTCAESAICVPVLACCAVMALERPSSKSSSS